MTKNIVVPEGMLRAAYDAQLATDPPTLNWDECDELTRRFYRRVLSAALKWLSENPILPSEQFAKDILDMCQGISPLQNQRNALIGLIMIVAEQWQRQMFLAPEPEMPDSIRDLLVETEAGSASDRMDAVILNERVLEAFRRGQKAGNKPPQEETLKETYQRLNPRK